MPDREKVIKGLEHCEFDSSHICWEDECPYFQSHDCTDELKNDILVLLKEQEDKIRQLRLALQIMNGNGIRVDTPTFDRCEKR